MSIIYINSYQFAAAPPSGYDPDAVAYIARVEGASGDNQALETAVKDAINAFVVGCKSDGIWSAIKHSCILSGARKLAGALQPLVTGGTAPTSFNFLETDYNRKTGLKGNAGNKYLATGVNANSSPVTNNHLAVFVTEAPSGNFTVVTGANTNYRIGRGNNSLYSQHHETALLSLHAGTPLPTGLYGMSRNNASNYTSRVNGTNATGGATTATITDQIFMYRQLSAVPSDSRLAYYSIGESLDLALLDARVTTLINAFAAAIP